MARRPAYSPGRTVGRGGGRHRRRRLVHGHVHDVDAVSGVNVLPIVIGGSLVIAGHQAGVVSRGLSTAVPRWFGRISFSLYLWHWPVLVLVAALTASGRLNVPLAMFCIVESVVLAGLSYRFVEQPARRSTVLRGTRRGLQVGLGLVVITLVSSVVVGQAAEARVRTRLGVATAGIVPIAKADRHLLFIGDSVTDRGQAGTRGSAGRCGRTTRSTRSCGRPVASGDHPVVGAPCARRSPVVVRCLLASVATIPKTLVIALGSNSFGVSLLERVRPPTAEPLGLRGRMDSHWALDRRRSGHGGGVRSGSGPCAPGPPGHDRLWVGNYLDDALWLNVHWREDNSAMRAAAEKYPNAMFLDDAAYVQSAGVPHLGRDPAPDGMALRAELDRL